MLRSLGCHPSIFQMGLPRLRLNVGLSTLNRDATKFYRLSQAKLLCVSGRGPSCLEFQGLEQSSKGFLKRLLPKAPLTGKCWRQRCYTAGQSLTWGRSPSLFLDFGAPGSWFHKPEQNSTLERAKKCKVAFWCQRQLRGQGLKPKAIVRA